MDAVCSPNSSTLCFQGGKFSATLTARDQRTGKTGTGQAIPQNDLFGYFSIPALTNDPSNPEVFIKVLDGRPANGYFWVFYGGLTDLEYTIAVRSATTGLTRTYTKPAGSPCGGFDTSALPLATLPPEDGFDYEEASSRLLQAPQKAAIMPHGACNGGADRLCLNASRFQVTLTAVDPRTGRVGSGQAIPQNNLFGYFSIPALTNDPNNPEVFVKVLDGTAANGKFWVFYGGLTDLQLTLTVTDTATGAVKTYKRSGGSSCGGFDTEAFSPGAVNNNYSLTVTKSGPGQGTVTGAGISCGADCSESYSAGASVTLTASPVGGFSFGGWNGCNSVASSTCSVTMNTNRTVTATFNGAPTQTVNFPGGSLSDLKALNGSLTFPNLNLTGFLKLTPSDPSEVTIRADSITIGGGAGIRFDQSDCSYRPAPNVTLIATGSVHIDGGRVLLDGKSGRSTSDSSTCNSCNGVRSGSFAIQAATVSLGETAETDVDLTGGRGATSYIGYGIYSGCAGGDGGTAAVSGTAAVTLGKFLDVSYGGGGGGTGSGTGSSNGTSGKNGAITFSGALPTVYESVGDNAHRNSAQRLTYQPFDIAGDVNQADDQAARQTDGTATVIFTNNTSDFCEDLYVLEFKEAVPLRVHLSSAGPGDLDLYLADFPLTKVLASSNGPTSEETITYRAAATSYVVCVSWPDSNQPANQPQPYRLSVGQ